MVRPTEAPRDSRRVVFRADGIPEKIVANGERNKRAANFFPRGFVLYENLDMEEEGTVN